jgi:hypothetical protein
MCRLSRNPGSLTSRTPQGHVGLFRGFFTFTFYLLLFNVSDIFILPPWRWQHVWPEHVARHYVYKLISICLYAFVGTLTFYPFVAYFLHYFEPWLLPHLRSVQIYNTVSAKGHENRIVVVIVYGCGFLFLVPLPPDAGQVLVIHEVFRSHTQGHTLFGRTPLDEWSARPRDFKLAADNPKKKTFLPPAVFEPAASAEERTRTYFLTRAATWTGVIEECMEYFFKIKLLLYLWRMKTH